MPTIDLNADLGEECGDDEAMLEVVSSANVACGMHAGNMAVMRTTLASAAFKGVVAGAHPSYPDRATFGRTPMAHIVDTRDFRACLRAQLAAFTHLSAAAQHESAHPGAPIAYIKAHGALYNDASTHGDVARHLARAAHDHNAALMHQPDTWVQHYAEEFGVRFIAEVFADRAYLPDGSLAPRGVEGAVLHDPAQIAERVVQMATEHTVETITGTTYQFPDVDSVCVHGDTPGAVAIARAVRTALEAASVTIQAPDLTQTRTTR